MRVFRPDELPVFIEDEAVAHMVIHVRKLLDRALAQEHVQYVYQTSAVFQRTHDAFCLLQKLVGTLGSACMGTEIGAVQCRRLFPCGLIQMNLFLADFVSVTEQTTKVVAHDTTHSGVGTFRRKLRRGCDLIQVNFLQSTLNVHEQVLIRNVVGQGVYPSI